MSGSKSRLEVGADLVTVAEAQRTPYWGLLFLTRLGAVGRVLASRSAKGELLAELTCTSAGCLQRHVRVRGDWDRCGLCIPHEEALAGLDALLALAATVAKELETPSHAGPRQIPGRLAFAPSRLGTRAGRRGYR